jgi:hypothetical protein
MADGQPHAGELGGTQGPRCSFCGRAQAEAGPLVEGQGPQGAGGAFICAQCVELVRKIFEQVQQRPPGETLHDDG